MKTNNEPALAWESFKATYHEMVLLLRLRDESDFINDANQRFVLYAAINRALSNNTEMQVNAKEISSELQLSFQTTQKILNYLVDKKYLIKERNPMDKRIYNYHPTEAAIDLTLAWETIRLNSHSKTEEFIQSHPISFFDINKSNHKKIKQLMIKKFNRKV